MNLLLISCQQTGKKSEIGKNGPTHEPRYRASAKISFIIAIQPFYGCQRNVRKNITVTVSVRVSVLVRASLVWLCCITVSVRVSVTVRVSLVWFVSSKNFATSSVAICRPAVCKLTAFCLYTRPAVCIASFFIICPIAMVYSMGQIIKAVCLCPCVQSVCVHSHAYILWWIFTEIGTDVKNPKSKNEFVGSKHCTTPCPQNILGEEVLKIHANINNIKC